MIIRSFIIDGDRAELNYKEEKQEIFIFYRNRVLYQNQISSDHVILTVDWIGEALLRCVVEHHNRKEKSQLELLAVAQMLGWEKE